MSPSFLGSVFTGNIRRKILQKRPPLAGRVQSLLRFFPAVASYGSQTSGNLCITACCASFHSVLDLSFYGAWRHFCIKDRCIAVSAFFSGLPDPTSRRNLCKRKWIYALISIRFPFSNAWFRYDPEPFSQFLPAHASQRTPVMVPWTKDACRSPVPVSIIPIGSRFNCNPDLLRFL